jgi:hypothetical protein
MAIPHYTDLVPKMLGLCSVISIRGDIKWVFDCDRESCEMAVRLATSIELQDLKQDLSESLSDPVMLEAKTSKTSI